MMDDDLQRMMVLSVAVVHDSHNRPRSSWIYVTSLRC